MSFCRSRSAEPAESAETPKAGFFSKSTSRKTSSLIAGATLVVGIAMGAGTGANSGQELTNAESSITALTAEVETLESQVSELDLSATKVDAASAQTAKDLKTAQDRVKELETQLTGATADLTAKTERIAELELASAPSAELRPQTFTDPVPPQPAPPVEAPAPPPAPAPEAPATYYANCTEVRNAGAAPIRMGDPGYSSKLDRDGDGIACE